jgi:hypothetical protein
MNMQQHIIAGLQEAFDRWEELLSGKDEEQISTALVPSSLSIKDTMAHLAAWQQRTIARVEAALHDHEPAFPNWPSHLDPDAEDSTDSINAWIYESNREKTWAVVHQAWKDGFQRFLALAQDISERDLLDSSRYSWLGGYPLVFILLASYDHHQEHYEKLLDWLREHGRPDRNL